MGKIDLDEASTTDLKDIQRVINESLDQGGLANQTSTDATSKTYSSNNVVANGDNQKVAIGKVDAEFDTSTGHDHDGANSKAIDASDLSSFNNFFSDFQENTFDAASGTSIVVTSEFSGKSAGGDTSTLGVVTTAPNNLVEIFEKDTGQRIEDGEGDQVFARVTEAAAVWTLSFFTNEAGSETAHSLSSQNIRFMFVEIFSASTRPTLGSRVGGFDSLSAVSDIPDATASQAGKVNTSAQTFGGVKEFASRPTTNSIAIVDISVAQVITNKDIDGGTAANTRRITIPKDTTVNLDLLTDKEATIAYDTTLNAMVFNDGSVWAQIGAGGGGFTRETLFLSQVATSGTDGGTSTAATFITRILDTSSGITSFLVSLSSNAFTLSSGDYIVYASAPAFRAGSHLIKLRNTSDSTDDIIGGSSHADSSNLAQTHSFLHGPISIGSNKTFEIQHAVGVGKATNGFGVSHALASNVYTQVQITKIG